MRVLVRFALDSYDVHHEQSCVGQRGADELPLADAATCRALPVPVDQPVTRLHLSQRPGRPERPARLERAGRPDLRLVE